MSDHDKSWRRIIYGILVYRPPAHFRKHGRGKNGLNSSPQSKVFGWWVRKIQDGSVTVRQQYDRYDDAYSTTTTAVYHSLLSAEFNGVFTRMWRITPGNAFRIKRELTGQNHATYPQNARSFRLEVLIRTRNARLRDAEMGWIHLEPGKQLIHQTFWYSVNRGVHYFSRADRTWKSETADRSIGD